MNKVLVEGMPWRGVPNVRVLVPILFGENATWESAKEIFNQGKLNKERS